VGEHQELDWFGKPLDGGEERRPVPCPICGDPFTTSGDLRSHLRQVHHQRSARPSRFPAWQRWFRSLGWLPLWFVMPANAAMTIVVLAVLLPVDVWLALFVAGLSTFPLVLVLSHRIFMGKG
jgi:hypothetical protein